MESTTTTTAQSTSPLRSMARLWPLSLVLVLLGTLLGAGYANGRPTTYTAEARLAVGGTDIAAQAIPGFALASQEIASNYARFVSTAPTAQALPAGERGALVSTVASPIPSSNVILLEAKATSASVALDAAGLAATTLAKQVNDAVDTNDAAKTLQAYTDVSAKVASAQAAHDQAQRTVTHLINTLSVTEQATSPELAAAQKALARASTTLSEQTVQQTALGNRYQSEINATPSQSRLSIVQAATPTGDDKTTRLERYGVLGLAAGFVLALLAAAGIDRLRSRSGRRRGGSSGNASPADAADLADLSAEHFRTPPPPSPVLPRR